MNWIEISHLKGSGDKSKGKKWKKLGRRRSFQYTNYGFSGEGEVYPVETAKVLRRHIIGGLLSMRLQQAVLLNSIKEKCEGLGSLGLS